MLQLQSILSIKFYKVSGQQDFDLSVSKSIFGTSLSLASPICFWDFPSVHPVLIHSLRKTKFFGKICSIHAFTAAKGREETRGLVSVCWETNKVFPTRVRNCYGTKLREYPKKSKTNSKLKRKAKPYWPELFGRSDDLRVTTALKNLRRKTVTDKEVRIKLACLAIVSSVLLATNLKMKMIKEHADAMVDLEEFFSFPWGRLAFEMLMGSIKQRNEVSLSTDTIAVKGFALALQLVMVEAVPALTEVVMESYSSSDSDSSDDGDDFILKKNRQKTLSPGHARELDKTKDVVVRSIIPEDPDRPILADTLQWADEVMDQKVDNMLRLVNEGYSFTAEMFKGGATKVDVERMREIPADGGKRKRKTKPVNQKETEEEKRIAAIVLSMLQSEFERVDANVANAVSLSDKTAVQVESLETRIMVAIKNELQKFKEEVIRSVMEIHNKENGTTVRRGGNVSNSNNQQPDGDDVLPHRDANAAERGADARTLSTANTASPFGVQPNVPSLHDSPLSANSQNMETTKIAVMFFSKFLDSSRTNYMLSKTLKLQVFGRFW
ncbi:hypothetical protein BRARA_B01729 [Brassica rapa]|uniref:DUF1985 domain-containing protein n=1 Tax=Brassica campestris TaxID=3711 RepID=A0A398A9W7_BRACM|nr:hypothetical protein BRARA_B01729 [Brassica rapa]